MLHVRGQQSISRHVGPNVGTGTPKRSAIWPVKPRDQQIFCCESVLYSLRASPCVLRCNNDIIQGVVSGLLGSAAFREITETKLRDWKKNTKEQHFLRILKKQSCMFSVSAITDAVLLLARL